MVSEQALKTLKRYFGYDSFRPSQEPVVGHLLSKKDCLAIMPTGAGKSICFQIPALVSPGLTIVFTPLISLMKDQVDGLQLQRIPATYLNSTLSMEDVHKRMAAVAQGKVKLLYMAPERLESQSFAAYLRRMPISQVIIDEAHCVSQWGHDFRPSYKGIYPFIQSLPQKPVIGAFTATATREVEEDIQSLLGLTQSTVFIAGFDRPNLSFAVHHSKDRLGFVLDYVKCKGDQSGVIYCATRKDVERVYEALNAAGVKAGYYHAGLSDVLRKKEQERYSYDEIQVMVATNAFGMGIDKSNVRYVIHYQMPANMESYYQEAGRAGRDGAPAECILLYSGRDVMIQRYLIEQSIKEGKRKDLELGRLQDMVDYCFTTNCLRKYILEYFGERPKWERCNHCSTCERQDQTMDMTNEAKMVFKTIAYTEERYGAGMIVDILEGVETDRIRRQGFHRIPYFGKLSHMDQVELKGFIQTLVATNYLSVTPGKYPLLQLTAAAENVLEGLGRVKQIKAQVYKHSSSARRHSAIQNSGIHKVRNPLFSALREIRKELAAKDKVPPYLVFADTVLLEMSRLRPRTLAEMAQIKGIGDVKLKKYGLIFLKAIQECKEDFS